MLAVWTDCSDANLSRVWNFPEKKMRKSLICRAFLIFFHFFVLWGEKVPPLGFIRD
jgi:hypothetical protein